MLTQSTKEYIWSFLEHIPIARMEARLKRAATEGYFSSERARQYHSCGSSLEYWAFVAEYRRIMNAHRSFSGDVSVLLSSQNTRLQHLAVYLERAVELSSAVMGITACLNDRWDIPGWYSRMNTELLSFAEITTDEATEIAFTPYLFDGFIYVLMNDVWRVVSSRNQKFLIEFAELYSYGSVDIARGIIESYIGWLDEDLVRQTINQKRDSRARYRDSREKASVINRVIFDAWEIKMQGILYLDQYVEEEARFALRSGIGDLMLRYKIAELLFEKGLVESADPFDIPQEQLLLLCHAHGEERE